MDSSVVIDANPGLSPSRFVKVFMHGKAFGRKINLALHNSYDSLSLTLKRLGSNYSLSQEELNNLAMNEEDGAADDNDFVLWYENVDGDRLFLGAVPWELFTISVKKIYIAPPENQDDNGDYLEEGAGDNGDGNGGAAVGDEVAIGEDEEAPAAAADAAAAGAAEEVGDGVAIAEDEEVLDAAGEAEEAGDGAAIGEVEDAGSVAGDIGDGSVEDADMPEI
ncbi:hypothetical protein BRADI_4g22050v3 [Brachypodium distachyon]|uniref:Auxin-responsive protein n=1 Tax=Brachypodium distachyon TaxID=15368 RepID=I1IMI1_BRADI|nr:hypothetical protein BRADI_4g22050v3 [Brachypodium distachyon]